MKEDRKRRREGGCGCNGKNGRKRGRMQQVGR